MFNRSYAQTAQGVAAAMQRYAVQRQPYQRAADEIELAVMSTHANVGKTGFATASADQQGQELQEQEQQQPGVQQQEEQQQLGAHEEL
jgi:hypothetical protein